MAGFRVVGVDVTPRPRYCGDGFLQMDAFAFFDAYERGEFAPAAAFAASPPCQAHTSLNKMWNARPHLDLIPATRARLQASGLPYVIENVPGAPLENYVVLCGTMFRLGIPGYELRRHRWFELGPAAPLLLTPPCQHGWGRGGVIGVYGDHGRDRRRNQPLRTFSLAERQAALGIAWMTSKELSQAIPPSYTNWLGRHLLTCLPERTAG